MRRIEYLQNFSVLFLFQTLTDSEGNEYVVLRNSCSDLPPHIADKTEFEASCNHIHLLSNVRKDEIATLKPIAQQIAQTLLKVLKHDYPHKHFKVFATISDSFIIRFHQDWPGESPYCRAEDFRNSREFVYMVEG